MRGQDVIALIVVFGPVALLTLLGVMGTSYRLACRSISILTGQDARKRAEETAKREAEKAAAKRQREAEDAAAKRQREASLNALAQKRSAEERERVAKQRRDDNIARAMAAFAGHWTADHIVQKRYWGRSEWLDDLFPPDVVVRCDEDGDIELFKATRVRAYEATNRDLKDARDAMAEDIRDERRQGREEKQAELAREAYLRARLAEQISVHIDELPPLEVVQTSGLRRNKVRCVE